LVIRLTPQRQAVLDVLAEAHDHPTATQVFERVRSQQPGIGAATVYRALGVLVADGQARMLTLGEGAAARYDAKVSRHDHVVCTACGAAMDVDAPLPDEVVAELAARTGYDLREYDLQFRGRCPSCQRRSASQRTQLHARPHSLRTTIERD
jgi:Fur family ferric uptake transcriptional regulator/Fur family peroxide stress response transcriptional regulator